LVRLISGKLGGVLIAVGSSLQQFALHRKAVKPVTSNL
jgi:hypothetical protein